MFMHLCRAGRLLFRPSGLTEMELTTVERHVKPARHRQERTHGRACLVVLAFCHRAAHWNASGADWVAQRAVRFFGECHHPQVSGSAGQKLCRNVRATRMGRCDAQAGQAGTRHARRGIGAPEHGPTCRTTAAAKTRSGPIDRNGTRADARSIGIGRICGCSGPNRGQEVLRLEAGARTSCRLCYEF